MIYKIPQMPLCHHCGRQVTPDDVIVFDKYYHRDCLTTGGKNMNNETRDRINRGLHLVDDGRVGGKQQVIQYRVRGDTDTYLVTKLPSEEWICTCPDHVHRGMKCKHIWAVIFKEEGA